MSSSMTIRRPQDGRAATELEVEVELTASPEDPERTIVGFYPFDTATVELPFELSIDTRSIGGPSAGLAFTLDADRRAHAPASSRRRVVSPSQARSTLDGTSARSAGCGRRPRPSPRPVSTRSSSRLPRARTTSPPPSVLPATVSTIIPVATLDEALAALERLGGDPTALGMTPPR